MSSDLVARALEGWTDPAAVFLAGPGGSFITGQGIGVNGGSVMP